MTDKLLLEAIENLAAGVWEIPEQLIRIADVLEKQAPARSPDLRKMTKNSLASDTDKYRNPPAAAHLAAIDEVLAEVAEHDCTKPPEQFQQGCYECKYENTCRDFVPF